MHLDARTTIDSEPNAREGSPSTFSPSPGEIEPSSNPQTQAPAPITILSPAAVGGNPSSVFPSSLMLNTDSPSSASPVPSPPDVDPQIIEALKSKDRIYVLKLGEQMESLIKEKRPRVDLTPTTSYQRLLVHRCSAYYKLVPETDPLTKNIFVQRTPDSRIPERRMSELVPPESSSQPAFKIMRRSQGDRRNKPHSQAGSVAGEDGDLSDVEPSEAGSLGGRSSAAGGSKKHMTIQEREAAYNEARSRIFMGFEEKEKAKEKDMSASSSSLSLTSASASSANEDSLGDLDGSITSPATESEWSGPSGQHSRDRKDHNRRGNASASSSTRSMRSGYHGNHSNPSSRNSRAPSPSFKYASLYEPAPSQQLYDPNQPPNQMNAPYGTQYYHPFAPVPQGYAPPYNAGWYPPYPGYPPPHDPHHPPPDPSRPIEHYPSPQMGYPHMWHPPNQPPPIQTGPLGQQGPMQHHQTHQGHAHPAASPPPQPPAQYPYGQPPGQYPYGAPAGYGHPAPGYYPPPPPQIQPAMAQPSHPSAQMPIPGHMYDGSPAPHHGPPQPPLPHTSSAPPPHGYNFNQNGRSPIGNGLPPPQPPNGRNNARNPPGPQPNSGHGNKGRNNAAIARNPWSYGPGISSGGHVGPPGSSNADIVGPRLTSARRQSNLSGGSSRASSYNDDGLSTTVRWPFNSACG
ncbi:hypothetical protein BKA70DRAFT_1092461 [Coprinopsis sp. MPI-PUGE-AT-0042]|nr:hypothetical protein BKA70DRAFT_1092461 [Coprinopsis sp. MPI-PUGE-AT-0042]